MEGSLHGFIFDISLFKSFPQIEGLANAGGQRGGGGMGVARYGSKGLVIFVEGALPGAKVQARVTKVKGGYVDAVSSSFIEQSPFW